MAASGTSERFGARLAVAAATLLPMVLAGLLAAGPAHAAPPTSDNFANAQGVSCVAFSVNGTNVEATRETGEPVGSTGSTAWYSWQASKTGTVRMDVCESESDKVLGVYTGATLEALTGFAANDETDGCGPNDHGSRVEFEALEGTAYRVRVAGEGPVSAAAGNYVLLGP